MGWDDDDFVTCDIITWMGEIIEKGSESLGAFGWVNANRESGR